MNYEILLKLPKKTGKTCFTTLVIPEKIKGMVFENLKLDDCFGVGILDGFITTENAVDDKVNLKYVINNLKKITKPIILKKKNKKLYTVNNGQEPLTGRRRIIYALKSGTFPMKNIGFDIDNNDCFIYHDELYHKGTLTPGGPNRPIT